MPANPVGIFPQYFYGGKIMSVFETIKAAVTLRQAAEHYGLRYNQTHDPLPIPQGQAPKYEVE